MEQFTMNLIKSIQRPVIRLDSFHGIRAMLDTGAIYPVWVAPERSLVSLCHVTLERKGISFSGFGGSTQGNLYKLPIVQIGKLIFPNMRILTGNTDVPCDMILSATMFKNLIYEIDDKNHKLNVTVPDDESLVRNIVIRNSRGNDFVLCGSETDAT